MLDFFTKIFWGVVASGLVLSCCGKKDAASSYVSNYPSPIAINTSNSQSNGDINSETVIWQRGLGQSSLIWTTKDVYLATGEKKESLFAKSFEKFHNSESKTALINLKSNKYLRNSDFLKNKTSLELTSRANVVIKSVVGNIVTFEVGYTSALEGFPASNDTWWLSLDLYKSGHIDPFSETDGQNYSCQRILNLNEIFSEKDLLAAVLENQKVQQSIIKEGLEHPPISLRELFENDGRFKANPRIEIGEGGNFLTPDSFEHFIFDRIENNKIVVKLSLQRFAESNKYDIQFIEISLPIPNKYSNQISLADSKTQGFLGKDIEGISNGRSTFISFNTVIPLSTN